VMPSGGNGGPYHYSWSDGSPDTNFITVIPGRETEIVLSMTDNCTVEPAVDTITVPVLQGPLAEFTYENPNPGGYENNIYFINLSEDADNWLWVFPDTTFSIDLNPVHQFPEEGDYEVKLITYNNSGCVDSISYVIRVSEPLALFYPNAFTPNGDGLNDYFKPLGASLAEYDLNIYNRWGQVIFSGDELSAWDGREKPDGKLAPNGVYVFRIELKDERFEKKVITGRVTLIR